MVAIRHDGRAFPSNAELRGRYCLRACFTNHRTEAEDVDALLAATLEHGARLASGRWSTSRISSNAVCHAVRDALTAACARRASGSARACTRPP